MYESVNLSTSDSESSTSSASNYYESPPSMHGRIDSIKTVLDFNSEAHYDCAKRSHSSAFANQTKPNKKRKRSTRSKTKKTSTGYNVTALRRRIVKKSVTAVKRSPHNRQKKPWSTVTDSVPDLEAAMLLFNEIPSESNTAQMIVWKIHGTKHVSKWLNGQSLHDEDWEPVYVHPVKYDGKVWRIGGIMPRLDPWATYEELEAKYDKKTNILTIKFRTQFVGHGNPMGVGAGACAVYSSLI